LTGQISAALAAGDEGRGAREHQGLEAHLLVYLSGVRDGRRGFVGEEHNAAWGVLDGGGVPVGER
jgi:hypothetical protein